MTKATFYHAGCPVCVSAESTLLDSLDRTRFQVEVVHLGEKRDRIDEAESLGVRSVPALVLDENVLHINFGAALNDVRGGEQ
ncbi:MAG: thioredoxin family protein [Planctomycetota bacterium]